MVKKGGQDYQVIAITTRHRHGVTSPLVSLTDDGELAIDGADNRPVADADQYSDIKLRSKYPGTDRLLYTLKSANGTGDPETVNRGEFVRLIVDTLILKFIQFKLQ